jgi:hypothetical protein
VGGPNPADDKRLWDQFLQTGHLDERSISVAVFADPLQSPMLAILFKQFKMILRLGGDAPEWQQDSLELKFGKLF